MGSPDRTKVIVIAMFAAVLLAAVGGILWYFKIHAPQTRMADAQTEVMGWDLRWTEARTCLLGKTPASSKVSEALAIRELSPDPWERKTCTTLISQLSRGEAVDTRVPAVEDAWRGLDKAATHVATSFISHVDPSGDVRKKPDPLSVALDELEGAYAKLRAAAELPPAKPVMDSKPLPAAAIVPLTFSGKRILSVQEPYMTSRAGLLAFGTIEGAELQLQLVTNKPPVITAVGAGMQRAMPDGSWGARAIPDGIEVGQIDDKAVMAAPIKLAMPGPAQVIAVVGSWADGVVVYGAGSQLVVARGKAGTFTPDKPYTVRSMAFATDADSGEVVLAFADDKEALQMLRLVPGALDTSAVAHKAAGYPQLLCLTSDAALVELAYLGEWYLLDTRAPDAEPTRLDGHHLMGCSPGGAVVFKDDGEASYRRCAQGECEAVISKAQKRKVPSAAVPNGIVGVEARGGVLAVRKGGPTDFYAVPNGLVPVVAMTDGNVVDVLAWDADGLVIARVSAK